MKKTITFLAVWFLLAGVNAFAADVKNIIWVIGDGMGPETMGFFMEGVRYAGLPNYPKNVSAMETLLNKSTWGLYFNNTYDTLVTDSAASATQMATGQLSRPQFIGVDYNKEPVETLLEAARKKGKAIGIISDAYITDATPACFTAHTNDRNQKTEIAQQIIELAPEVVLGGGLKYFKSEADKGTLLDKAKEKGYSVVFNKKELAAVKKGKVLGLFSAKGMPMAVEMHRYPDVPDVVEQTQKALDLLENNKEGFVLMVEVGKIDWAAHANDAGALFQEMELMDKLLAYLQKYTDQHKNTLLYINADHDTGLGSFHYHHVNPEMALRKTAQGEALYGNGDTDYGSFKVYHELAAQKDTLQNIAKQLNDIHPFNRTPRSVQEKLTELLGYPVDITQFKNPTDIGGVLHQLNEQRGFVWATHSHSSAPLIGIAYGAGAEAFGGVYHNTDIYPRMKKVLGWSK